MIDETLDAATSYSGSRYVRGLYPGASLIAEPEDPLRPHGASSRPPGCYGAPVEAGFLVVRPSPDLGR